MANEKLSTKQDDMRANHVVEDLLDQYFYPVMKERYKRLDCSFERYQDKEHQYLGIDVIMRADPYDSKIDEKAAMDYLKKQIPTFAFELLFNHVDGSTGKVDVAQLQEGWFVNDELETDAYLMLWPESAVEKRYLTIEDFSRVEMMTVRCEDLHRALDEMGLTKDVLRATAYKIRHTDRFEKIYPKELGLPVDRQGVYFYYTRPEVKPEAPVNLILGKSFLQTVARKYYCLEKIEGEEGYRLLQWR